MASQVPWAGRTIYVKKCRIKEGFKKPVECSSRPRRPQTIAFSKNCSWVQHTTLLALEAPEPKDLRSCLLGGLLILWFLAALKFFESRSLRSPLCSWHPFFSWSWFYFDCPPGWSKQFCTTIVCVRGPSLFFPGPWGHHANFFVMDICLRWGALFDFPWPLRPPCKLPPILAWAWPSFFVFSWPLEAPKVALNNYCL